MKKLGISRETAKMLHSSIKNFKKGRVGGTFDPKEFPGIINSTTSANKHAEINDDWITPKYILKELGKFDLDPCASVKQPWRTARKMINKNTNTHGPVKWIGNRVFLNPPYGRAVVDWMRLMAINANGIALIAARVDTDWFQRFVFGNAHSVLFLKGRIVFYTPEGKKATIVIKKGKNKGKRVVAAAGFPSALVAYTAKDTAILKKAQKKLIGHLVLLKTKTKRRHK